MPERTAWCGAAQVRACLALALAALLGTVTLDASFVFDDHTAIELNPVVTSAVPAWQGFVRDFWGFPLGQPDNVSYRPLIPLLWRMLYAIAPWPWPFHALSLLLHLAAVAAFLWAGVKLCRDSWLVATAALIFAVHATHAEALGANVSHADLASAVLGLLALGLAADEPRPRRALLVGALVLMACLCKESAGAFAAAAMALVALRARPIRERARYMLAIATPALAVAAVELSLTHLHDPRYNMTLAYDAHGLWRLLLGLAFYARGLVISFVPLGLAPKHSYAAWDLSLPTLLPQAIPGALLMLLSLAAVVMAFRAKQAVLLAVLVLLIAPSLLNSGLIVQVPNELPERTFYPATMAASGLLAWACLRMPLRLQRPLLGFVVLAMLAQHVRAQRPWHDEVSLFTFALAQEPKSAELHMFMAHAQAERDHVERALWHALVTSYIASQRPAYVDFGPVRALQELAPEVRIRVAPERMSPVQTCRFVHAMLGVLRHELPSLEAAALRVWHARYPQCLSERSISVGLGHGSSF